MGSKKDFYIVKETALGKEKDYLLKLDRNNKRLVVLHQVERSKLHNHFSIRRDFNPSGYVMYEGVKTFDCIFGGEKSPTPEGMFQVEYKTTDEYVSGYYPEHDKVKFFGYLVIFEDYFIHSDLYDGAVTEAAMRAGEAEPISKKDDHTSGCVRIAQENLDWLVENIPVGTTVVL